MTQSQHHQFWPHGLHGEYDACFNLLIEGVELPPMEVRDIRSGKRYRVSPIPEDFPFTCSWWAEEITD